LLGCCTLCGCESTPTPHRTQLVVFGSEASIEIRGVPESQADGAAASVSERLAEFGRDWHAWEEGPLTRINSALARGESAPAPASIRDLLRRSTLLSRRSGGLFDPTVGGLLELWGFHTSEFPVRTPAPTSAQIAAWRTDQPRIDDIRLDQDRISSRNAKAQLDFGAIAEGVAAEEAARLLSEHGVRHALLTLGGDVYALGSADGRPWKIGLRDPYGGVLAGVELNDREALFSSGNYNKFREAPSGARWSHVLDPRTGLPARGAAMVAVLDRDPVLADVAATVLMIAGPAGFAATLDRLGVRCALLLTEENELMLTAAMQARIALQREPVRLGPAIGRAGPCAP
jgi:thiamine biosynthesis lipoprotein